MRYKSARKFVLGVTIFSVTVAFAGTLVSSGLRDAFLMMIVIGGIIFCTGTLGLHLFWRNKDE